MNSEIVMIETEKIFQHPDNPRKDLGDLTELSESIKKNGIMQNLTVIPGHYEGDGWKEDMYTLIIGHRRCAAAELAGLETVPCRIVKDMDKKQQVSTMLEENMQRNDLTIYEQSQGFQMMLDLGETEESIAQKTGFSKSTVYHRLNIAKLDAENLKEKEQNTDFQLCLKDLYALEKIHNIDTRNKILKEAVNSSNLVFLANKEAEKEKRTKKLEEFAKLCEQAGIIKAPDKAKNERYNNKWDILHEWNNYNMDKWPEKLDNYEYESKSACWVDFGFSIAIICPAKQKTRKLSKWEIEEENRKKARKEIKQLSKHLFLEISRFIKEILNDKIKPDLEDKELNIKCIETLVEADTCSRRSSYTRIYFEESTNIYDLKTNRPKEYKEFCEWESKLGAVDKALCQMISVSDYETWNYNIEFKKENADKVKKVVEFLEIYGFSLDEESKKLLDGTHELYVMKEEAGR